MNKLYLLSEFVGNFVCFRAMIQGNDDASYGIVAQKNINSSEPLYGCDRLVYHCHHLTYIDNRKLQHIAKTFRKMNNAFDKQYERSWFSNSFLNAVSSLLFSGNCERKIYIIFAGNEKEISFDELMKTEGDWNLINSLIRES